MTAEGDVRGDTFACVNGLVLLQARAAPMMRNALAMTAIEDTDIATAAISGVT